ncbi:MAG: outer membrane beta-barrel protein [Thiohalomonadales bacterium]
MLRFLFLIILLNLSMPFSYAADSAGEAEFNSGVKYFKQKQFQIALNYFLQANKSGMKKSSLYFNIAVSYYKLNNLKKANIYFKYLTQDEKFRQIAFYNLGLIDEKQKKPQEAIVWYKKSVENNTNTKITKLSNIKLDKLLDRKIKNVKNKTQTYIRLAFGNNDNITNVASNSPSNKGDNYSEIYAFIKTAVSSNMSIKGSLYQTKYNTLSNEDFRFYSVNLDYLIKTKNWKIIPEISITKSTLNDRDYQNIIDYKLTSKRKLGNKSSLYFRYRFSDIESQNILYNYLQGQRHQLRIDYRSKVNLGNLRLRYQLETNDRKNRLTKNYSPTRHTLRTRLKHKFGNKWNLSEELAYRISTYESVAGVTREDTRLRLRVDAGIKINKEWAIGTRYTYTNNDSNIVSEDYVSNNVQLYSKWFF